MRIAARKIFNKFALPSDLLRLSHDTQNYVKTELSALKLLRHDTLEIVKRFDNVSNRLCIVADSSDCIHRLHPERRWKMASLRALNDIKSLMSNLNYDKELYNLISKRAKGGLDSESEKVLQILRHDFIFDRTKCAATPFSELERIQKTIEEKEQEFEIAAESRSPNASQVLESLIKSRFAYARTLGYATPAEMILSDKCLRSSKEVLSFLDEVFISKSLSKSLVPKFSAYCSLARIMATLKNLTERLFSVEIETRPAISFDGNESFFMKVRDLNGNSIGTIYWEFSHDNQNPTHFTIQCRRVPDQEAIVLLSIPQKCPWRVSFQEGQSIFHEFGHALHSILSETRYQVVSGTRIGPDLAEIPAMLFELMHQSHEIQELYSLKPCETECLENESSWIGQLRIAAIDQLIHSREPGNDGWIKNLVSEVEQRFPMHKGAPQRSYAHISHFASYAGMYYAYPFSNHWATKIWIEVFKKSANAVGGNLFKNSFLLKGGLLTFNDVKELCSEY